MSGKEIHDMPVGQPKFQVGSYISIPTRIVETGKAFVFGCEWGPGKRGCNRKGWVYYLIDVPEKGFPVYGGRPFISAEDRFEVGEDEIP